MEKTLFLESHSENPIAGAPALLGLPLDQTATYRSGTDLAPKAIRKSSDSIESYSPRFDLDLLETPFADLGDLDLAGLDVIHALTTVEEAVDSLLERSAKPFCLGGEHTVTLAVVRSLLKRYPDMVVVQADAHTDLRDDYEGERLSHATVMRRISHLVGSDRIIQLGIRSGTRSEFQWMRENDSFLSWDEHARQRLLRKTANRPLYFTLDLDVLDPSALPGTGNPELGGWNYKDLERLFDILRSVKLIGVDVVELNPSLDPTEASSIAAAKIVRELLLIFGTNH